MFYIVFLNIEWFVHSNNSILSSVCSDVMNKDAYYLNSQYHAATVERFHNVIRANIHVLGQVSNTLRVFLPPAAEGYGKVIFSLCLSVKGGGVSQSLVPGPFWGHAPLSGARKGGTTTKEVPSGHHLQQARDTSPPPPPPDRIGVAPSQPDRLRCGRYTSCGRTFFLVLVPR